MLARLIGATNRDRISSIVVSLSTVGTVGSDIERMGVPVFALGMRSGTPMWSALWRGVRLLRQFRPAVLQTWLYHADLAGLVAGTVARVPDIVWNIRCAELVPQDHPRSLPALLRTLAALSGRPSAIVCNSTAGRLAHEALGYHPRRWSLIPNGFDTGTFQPCAGARVDIRRELGLPDTIELVGLLARFHPMKDHATFLNAARIVSAARPDVHFVAAGRGVAGNAALEAMVAELKLGQRVHLLPARHDAARFLAALDVAVSSSYSEAFPNVVGEAMACGTPCVVTDVGDSALLVGDAGVMVPPRDPALLAAGILRVLDLDGSARASLGRAARERILSTFSLAGAAATYERLYLDLAGRQMRTPGHTVCAE
jgi:glycosyltransferase involved in cell wall biosynthesis